MWLTHATEHMPPVWAPEWTQTNQGMDSTTCWTHDTHGATAPDSGWFDCGDGWSCRLLDDERPPQREASDDEAQRIRLQDGTRVRSLSVLDMRDRLWLVPVVLRADGEPALDMPICRDDNGIPTRKPTELQERLIAAAGFLREIVANHQDGTPLECEIDCVAELLAAGMHMSAYGLISSGLLDDYLSLRVMLTTACPEPDAAEAI